MSIFRALRYREIDEEGRYQIRRSVLTSNYLVGHLQRKCKLIGHNGKSNSLRFSISSSSHSSSSLSFIITIISIIVGLVLFFFF
jgi:hypothetical protein